MDAQTCEKSLSAWMYLYLEEASIAVSISPLRKRRQTVLRPWEKSLAEPKRELEVLMAQSSAQTTKPHCFPFRRSGLGLEGKCGLPLRAERWFAIHSPGCSVKRGTDSPALNCGWKLVFMCRTHWSIRNSSISALSHESRVPQIGVYLQPGSQNVAHVELSWAQHILSQPTDPWEKPCIIIRCWDVLDVCYYSKCWVIQVASISFNWTLTEMSWILGT